MLRIYLLMTIVLSQLCLAQLDNTHYLQPVIFTAYNDDPNGTISEEYVYLSTNSTSVVDITIRYPDNTRIPRLRVYDINDNTSKVVTTGEIQLTNVQPLRLAIVTDNLNFTNTLPPGSTPLTVATSRAGSIIPSNIGGLKFTSDNGLFYVNYRGRSSSQAGSSMTKGKAALGKEFFWGGTPTELPTTISTIGSMASMMATEDNTIVTVSNIDAGTEFLNGSGSPLVGPTITRTLNKGQSFILFAQIKVQTPTAPTTIQGSGWLGAQIKSNKNIAVTVGGLMQQGGTNDARDFALDQLVPVEQLGTEYVAMQGKGGDYEKVVIIATKPNTEIHINGSSAPSYTLPNIGDHVIVPASFFIQKNMFIKSDKAIYVFHKIFGGIEANNNSFMFIPPLSCFGPKEVNQIPDASRIGTTHYQNTELAVLAASGEANKPVVTMNNNSPFAPLNNANGVPVPGNNNWVTYRYNIGATEPDIIWKQLRIKSQSSIQAELMGSSAAAGFGGYYSGFGTAPTLKINVGLPVFTSQSGDIEPCAGQSTLSVTPDLGTYQWYKDGSVISNATTNTYTLTASDSFSAEYNVIVTVPGGCTIYSEFINSAICPCSKPGATGTAEITKVGISTRASKSTPNWPADIKNGFIALESNDKGFVITRIANPETEITNPVNGMLVFDTDNNCLKIYDGSAWSCINQTCN